MQQELHEFKMRSLDNLMNTGGSCDEGNSAEFGMALEDDISMPYIDKKSK